MVAVGGSTTECVYLSDGKDWPARLGSLLRDDFFNVWVNNAGLDGHSTVGHTILVRDHIAKLTPDLVLFLVGLNDRARDEHVDPSRAEAQGSLRNSSWRDFAKSIAAYSDLASLGLDLGRMLRARTMGPIRREVDLRTVPKLQWPAARRDAELVRHRRKADLLYRRRLVRLVEITREAGMEPILATQPALFGSGVDPATGIELDSLDVEGIPGSLQWEVLEAYNDVTREVGRRTRTHVIDVARSMAKDSRYFYDFTHFTILGAEEVATILTTDLRSHLPAQFPQLRRRQRLGSDGSSEDHI